MLDFDLMANIKSQIKRIKQTKKAEERNKSVKSALKTHIKNFEQALNKKNLEEAKKELDTTVKKLDKAASKDVIHLNRASAKKSRLTKQFNSMQAAPKTKKAPLAKKASK